MAFLTISVASACWAVEAARATTAATAYGGLRDHRARLAYSGSISVSGPVCEVMVAVPTAGQRAQPTGNGVGVEGRSGGGKGVHGAASASPGIGVFAEHTGSGRALAVTGRAGFSSCGSGTIAAGQASRTVSNPAVTAESHITVTLTANPGASARIHWVARQAGSFTVHLTQRVSSSTSFTYLIVEPFDG